MTGPIAQIVSLTCYSNAFLHGDRIPQFFPTNSTCQFCEFIRFVEFRKALLGNVQEFPAADNPDEWIASLHDRQAFAARLLRSLENRPGFSDRMLAGFIGGGGQWTLELLCSNGKSEFWVSHWEVGNREAQDQRIWRESMAWSAKVRRNPIPGARSRLSETSLGPVWKQSDILQTPYGQDNFASCFAKTLNVLDNPDPDVGYHRDLWVPQQLAPEAASLLKAATSAWVFGGMGSWNDLSFTGDARSNTKPYWRGPFSILNEAIEVATSSSHLKGQLSADN